MLVEEGQEVEKGQELNNWDLRLRSAWRFSGKKGDAEGQKGYSNPRLAPECGEQRQNQGWSHPG